MKVYDIIGSRGVDGTCATMRAANQVRNFQVPPPEIRERIPTVEEVLHVVRDRLACFVLGHRFYPVFGTRGSGPRRVHCARWACDAEREVTL